MLVDQELESASRKTEDACKTSRLPTVKSGQGNKCVERHLPRTRIRPVSLPIDKLLLASSPTERNGRNMGNVNSDKVCKNPILKELIEKTPQLLLVLNLMALISRLYKKLGRNKETKMTSLQRLEMIVPSAFQERGVTLNVRSSGDHPVSIVQPSKPYTEPVRSARQVSERRSL